MEPSLHLPTRSRASSCVEFNNPIRVRSFSQRRQSAPSLILSKALTKTKSASREGASQVSPDACPLVQSLLSPSRRLLCHGNAQLQTGLQTQERFLFLFNDLLIISKAKSSTHVKLKACVHVCEMWTASCMDEVSEGHSSPDRSFVMGWPTHNCVATFSNIMQKEKWLSLIEGCIKEEKEKEEPKTIPLKIFAKDVGNYAYMKTLSVTNTDRTTVVIDTALQQFGLPGGIGDYQMWVYSSKEEAPYPLIGHEFPHSIKMSHVRLAQPFAVTPLYTQRALLSIDSHCQFILRPSLGANTQSLTDDSKSFRKKSLISWAFWRSWDEQPSSPTSPCPPLTTLGPTLGRLFGRPLRDVFDDRLPPPIMEMLVCLSSVGSMTRGIFRRSAGVKACRELRERLDFGHHDNPLCDQPVFVTAAVFKDFLRSIPGSLLCEELYEQWVRTMEGDGERDEENKGEEMKLQEVQRLVRLLPRENCLLLRYVVAMLHCIQSHSDHNQMNSFNLAVCIAPSMLWGSKPQAQGEDTKKVCELVRFLVDNCTAVFGEDITSLFGGLSQSDDDDHESSSLLQTSDSCYDSLEKELNADKESTPQVLPYLNAQRQDSLFSLSDNDLDQSQQEEDGDSSLPLANVRKFTPVVRQPRSLKLRRSSEPTLRHAPSGEEEQGDARKASLDSSTTQGPMRDEGDCDEDDVDDDENDEVFLKSNFHRQRLPSKAGGGGCQPRRLKQAPPVPQRLDSSCSSSSSLARSPTDSSVSSLDSACSQSSDHLALSSRPLACLQTSPPKGQSDRALQRNVHCQHPISRLKKDQHLSPRQRDLDVGDVPRRGSDPPSYQQALHQLHRTQTAHTAAHTPHTQPLSCSPPPELPHRNISPFYDSPNHTPPSISDCSPCLPTLCGGRPTRHTDTRGDVMLFVSPTASDPSLPQSVFFGQNCSLTVQRARVHPSQKSSPHLANVQALSSTEWKDQSCQQSPSTRQTSRDYFPPGHCSLVRCCGDRCGKASRVRCQGSKGVGQEVALAVAEENDQWLRCNGRWSNKQMFRSEESYV